MSGVRGVLRAQASSVLAPFRPPTALRPGPGPHGRGEQRRRGLGQRGGPPPSPPGRGRRGVSGRPGRVAHTRAPVASWGVPLRSPPSLCPVSSRHSGQACTCCCWWLSLRPVHGRRSPSAGACGATVVTAQSDSGGADGQRFRAERGCGSRAECGSDGPQGILLPQATENRGTGRGAGGGKPDVVPPELTLWTELVERQRQTRRQLLPRLGMGRGELT